MQSLIAVALGKAKADLVLKNALILDVHNQCFRPGDLAIHQGKIVGIGAYHGELELDCSGKYLVPGFIDGHMHLESTLLVPGEYTRMMLKHGVTTVIADPHEIANVSGQEGVRFLLESAKDLPIDFRFMLPSCVPCSVYEYPGSCFDIYDLTDLKTENQVLGLGEMMDFPGVLREDPIVLEKLAAFSDQVIDGHAPGLLGKELTAYAASGVMTDHECSTAQELEERIALGMYVQIREGTSAKNSGALLKAVTAENFRRIFFCTDDKHPTDLMDEGSIDHIIRQAIQAGIPPARAYTMASWNAAEAYRMYDRGALTPGKRADIVILDDLAEVRVSDVFTQGIHQVLNGKPKEFSFNHPPFETRVNIQALEASDVHFINDYAIDVQAGSLLTQLIKRSDSHAKLLLVERHHGKPLHAVTAINGFAIEGGAIATSIAHDAHNALCIGDNDQDMLLALRRLEQIQGGIVLAKDGSILGELELTISGLISDQPYEDVVKKLRDLEALAHDTLHVSRAVHPFLTLSFMALPVIPEVKLTLDGLYHVSQDHLYK